MNITAAILAGAMFICPTPRVIDGDTLQCNRWSGERVRLWGIQAPELGHSGGHVSKWSLGERLHGVRSITCRHVAFDRYGRTVARCYHNGQDLSAYQVRNGKARDWPRYSKGYYGND